MTNNIFLIIPDIHHKHEIAERIIKAEQHDIVILLGDYFDDFHDTPTMMASTVKWLKSSLENKNRIHLIGNHDLCYMTETMMYKCSGYTMEKHYIVRNADIKWDKLYMWYYADDWLCTHAGFANSFYNELKKNNDDVKTTLERYWNGVNIPNWEKKMHPFFQVGQKRGGMANIGGLLWCDYNEFDNIPNTKQIFGHTPHWNVRHSITENTESYCIDTHLRHYALIKDGQVIIKSV